MLCYRKRIYSGDVLELEEYQYPRKHNKRGKNVKATNIKQSKINEINSLKKLTRLINTNIKKCDLFVTLTYDEGKQADTEEQAGRDFKRYIARINYHLQSLSKENARYIAVIGKGEQYDRIHIHFVISRADKSLLKRLWHNGHIDIKLVYTTDHTELANYLFKHCKDKQGKRWIQSKKLKQPDIKPAEKYKYRFNPECAKDITNNYILSKDYTSIYYIEETGETICYYKFLRIRK